MRNSAGRHFRLAQQEICLALEQVEGDKLSGRAEFASDEWTRIDATGTPGGGGNTRVLKGGKVFEQAGVNFSEVFGNLPRELVARMPGGAKILGENEFVPFYTTGLSLVIHPLSPMVPTTHANVRYLEVGNERWFGGGMDLTPYYFFEEDACFFHRTIKDLCDRHDPSYYPRFKQWCDDYFFLPHRKEGRGIGGIFFDYLGKDAPDQLAQISAFVLELPATFLSAYLPLVLRRKDLPWTEAEKHFQLIRRGRYVEFNLLYDRGTQFGLHTNGRTESILMSLPPSVAWEYCYTPMPGSREEELLSVVKTKRDWIS